jgi:hypothetical protein
MPSSPAASYLRTRLDRVGLTIVIAVSAALRLCIAIRGGQYFWTDESRYVVSKVATADFCNGRFRAGLDALFSNADHLLFKVIGVIPALIQRAFGDYTPIAAVFFGAFSIGVIYLVWRLVLAQGGSSREALFAAFLVGASNTYFYYARHIFPYDAALCFFLCAALVGFRPGNLNSFLSGLLSSAGFLTYNGYWLFGGTLLILTVVNGRRPLSARIRQSAWGLLGLGLPILIVLGIGRALRHDLIRSYVDFSRTVVGDRGNSWRVIPEYFWFSEHYLFIFWISALIVAGTVWMSRRLEARVSLWLLGAVMFGATIVSLSDVIQRFTVFGRHARPLAIFFCFLGGWFLNRICTLGRNGAVATAILIGAIAVQSALNFSVPLAQMFPDEFSERSKIIVRDGMAVEAGIYRTLPGGYFEPEKFSAVRSRPHVLLDMRPHPLQFLPYTFDGWNEEIRSAFRSADISMETVRLLAEAPSNRVQISRFQGPWAPYLGPMQIEVIFDPDALYTSQPLISTGIPGSGDQLFAQFIGKGLLRLGFDHWGQGAIYSEPIHCDPTRSHTLVVSFGALYPGENDPEFKKHPDWLLLRHWVFVSLDGATVIKSELDTFPSEAASIVFFHNLIGLSSAVHDFSGRFLSVSAVPPDRVLSALGNHLSQSQGFWAPYVGAIRLELKFAPDKLGVSVPLISSGTQGAGDLLFAQFIAKGLFRLGFDHWGQNAIYSKPVHIDPDRPHVIVISYGSLYPAETDERFVEASDWLALRHRIYVSLDGETVINREAGTYQALPDSIVVLHNFVGFSTAARDFSGQLISVSPIPGNEILSKLR